MPVNLMDECTPFHSHRINQPTPMSRFFRGIWIFCLGWPGLLTIADCLGWETDLALKTALTNSGMDMFEFSSLTFGCQRHQFGLCAGVMMFIAAACVASGKREKTALWVYASYQAWLVVVCWCIANKVTPGELRRHTGLKSSKLAFNLGGAGGGTGEIMDTSKLSPLFIMTMALWRIWGLRQRSSSSPNARTPPTTAATAAPAPCAKAATDHPKAE